LRALDTQPRPHAFDFLSRAYRFRDAAGGAQYAIAFEMPISNLTATPAETPHKQRLHASLLAVVKDAHGEIVDRLSKDIPSEVSDEHLSAVRVELMTYQRAVNLPPGAIPSRPPSSITKATAPAPAWSRSTTACSRESESATSRWCGGSILSIARPMRPTHSNTPASVCCPS
jgi:hypothetical protein